MLKETKSNFTAVFHFPIMESTIFTQNLLVNRENSNVFQNTCLSANIESRITTCVFQM